jgi:hypothetical protein
MSHRRKEEDGKKLRRMICGKTDESFHIESTQKIDISNQTPQN